jgi:ribonuclease VapC
VIVVDASALVAIYLNEPERAHFLSVIEGADTALLAPVNAWEALAKAFALDGEAGVDRMNALIDALGLQTPLCDAEDVQKAIAAFARYGRRTPAALNLGDCFAYALAQRRGAPLLFKGDDFSKTDIVLAAARLG